MIKEVILLDSGPLGLLCKPRKHSAAAACWKWLTDLITAGRHVILPEIADYELRRELLRMRKAASVFRLDMLAQRIAYLAVTTDILRRAAELWAMARQIGQPTAGDDTIDADMILIAQAESLGLPTVIATTNVGHLSRFTRAEDWHTIQP